MNWNSPLFLLCSLAGFLLLAGSLYLLLKGIIDLKGGQGVSEMALPGGTKIKTPVPALVMFVLGVFMVVFPVLKSPDLCPDLTCHKKTILELVELHGKVSDATYVEVDAVVDEQEAGPGGGGFVLSVPFVENRRYTVRYLDDSGIELTKESFILRPGEKSHTLKGMVLQGAAPPPPTTAQLEQSEPSATVAEFK
jgi:hypothetical protein